ncbi:MAG: Nramp family divalent metal transporter [Bacteroidota bacterium]|jgi:manganese transport protein
MGKDKSLSEVHESVTVPHKKNFWKTLLAFIGPAYMVSVGYMDPGNWATDIAGGSKFGYQLIWVLLLSNGMALLLQSLAARLGIVKGIDLAQASRQQYPRGVNIALYVLAEIAIAACDLAEIIGMAIGLQLLFDLPLMYGVIITVLDTFILMFLLNKGIRKMEAFILALISIIGISFIAQLIIVQPQLGEVVKGVIPSSLSGSALYIAIGIIGATVMPHNLYLHSALVQTRKFEKTGEGIRKAIKFNFIDSAVALNLAFFVNASILILAAGAFYFRGYHGVADIQQAHLLLQGIFGDLSPTLFAIALIAAGQSSTITGTLAGQIVMEGYLNLRISPWIRRLLTRLIAIIPAVITIMYFGEEKLGDLLILSQVILSMQLGFAIIPLIHFTGSKKLMQEFAIGVKLKTIAWIVAAIIVSLNIKLVIEELIKLFEMLGADYWFWKILFVAIAIGFLLLLIYITFEPFFIRDKADKRMIPHGEALPLPKISATSYQRIAVTVDFSKHDEKTIQHALSIGGKQAEYLFIHVVESAGAIKMGEEIMDKEAEFDLLNLKKYQADVMQQGYRATIQLGFGKSAAVISDLVNESKVDLLVMGAHGHKGIKDLIFGTTLDQVRHNVHVPVFIVK